LWGVIGFLSGLLLGLPLGRKLAKSRQLQVDQPDGLTYPTGAAVGNETNENSSTDVDIGDTTPVVNQPLPEPTQEPCLSPAGDQASATPSSEPESDIVEQEAPDCTADEQREPPPIRTSPAAGDEATLQPITGTTPPSNNLSGAEPSHSIKPIDRGG